MAAPTHLSYSTIYRERFFSPEENPRLHRPLKSEKIRLYHFTQDFYIESIKQHGITRGDVPVHMFEKPGLPSDDCFNNAAWFSSDPSVYAQKWTGLAPTVRIAVVIDANDGNLWTWKDLATHVGADAATIRELRRSGGNDNDWWVYVNEPVSPTLFERIDDLTSTVPSRVDIVKAAAAARKRGKVRGSRLHL
ncbi:MAG TPA: hypothetical protein VGK19_18330 [Capsulimonadaceae bacterium]|jgi:hypothetical protein